MKKLSAFLVAILFSGLLMQLQSQTIGITFNVKGLNLNSVSADEIDEINFSVLQSFSLNARLFNDNLWAIRIGAGYEDVEYEVEDENTFSSYLANRNNYLLLLGLEKHFELAAGISIYPGIIVPITKSGSESYQPLLGTSTGIPDNEKWRTALGVVVGANIRFLRILHLGAEMQTTYDSFKQEVAQTLGSSTAVDANQISWRTEFTLGVYF